MLVSDTPCLRVCSVFAFETHTSPSNNLACVSVKKASCACLDLFLESVVDLILYAYSHNFIFHNDMKSKNNKNDIKNNQQTININNYAKPSSASEASGVGGDGWVTAVGKKKKNTKNKQASNSTANHSPSKASSSKNGINVNNVQYGSDKNKNKLGTNKFYLPGTLEKKLHASSSKKLLNSSTKIDGEGEKKKQTIQPSPSKPSYLSIMGLATNNNNSNIDHPKTTMEKDNLGKVRNSRGKRAKQRFGKQNVRENIYSTTIPLNISPNKTTQQEDPSNSSSAPQNLLSIKEAKLPDPDFVPKHILDLPVDDVLSRGILSFLGPKDLLTLGSCSLQFQKISNQGFLWKALATKHFKSVMSFRTTPISSSEWKLAYQVLSLGLDIRMRCPRTQKTFLADVLGLGVDYTINPKTRVVDYIAVSQDLMSETSFQTHGIRSDVFGSKYKLFLPLYFSQEHFQRGLPTIQRTIVRLCPERKTSVFEPNMILDVIPKIVTTFIVLLSDEGVSACQKSFEGFTRIHRLFLALAKEYPSIQKEAIKRLTKFIQREECRDKTNCPNLGAILPLLMIVDKKDFDWAKIRPTYLMETFDRSVLWACKMYPQLERITADNSTNMEPAERGYQRVALTREAMTVPLRLTMFHVYFLRAACQGSVTDRCNRYDLHFFQPPTKDDSTAPTLSAPNGANNEHGGNNVLDQLTPTNPTDVVVVAGSNNTASLSVAAKNSSPLSFEHFRDQINTIFSIASWKKFFNYVGLVGPKTQDEMAKLLRMHVKNSRRRKYHKAGMDFSRIHASGTSQILSKGQQYSASAGLKRVVFEDHWTFEGGIKYFDATCLLYSENGRLEHTVDYRRTRACNDTVIHSGDMMEEQSGTHTINIDLERLPQKIVTCVFVISAWSTATLKDITSASVAFRDADAEPDAEPLCVYHLESHDKISHLKSIIMCKLYRTAAKTTNNSSSDGGGWHVLAIGDSNTGSASNYKPIYDAVQVLLSKGGRKLKE